MLDRYPKKPGHLEVEVLRSVRMLGLPDPVDVRVSTEPLLPGAVRLRPNDLPRQVQGRPFRHVALDFDRTVAGPPLLGAGRYLEGVRGAMGAAVVVVVGHLAVR